MNAMKMLLALFLIAGLLLAGCTQYAPGGQKSYAGVEGVAPGDQPPAPPTEADETPPLPPGG